MKQFIYLALLTFTLFVANCGDGSPVIETIDGAKITVKGFENSYDTAIEAMSRMQNVEKKTLVEFIAQNIDQVPEQFKSLNFQFQKKNFFENYRQMLMVKIVAEKTGFSSRADIKEILQQVEMQTLSTLYIQEQVEKRIKITDEQAMEECNRLRAKNKELAAMPIDRCVMAGRGNLKQRESQNVLPKVIERIKEGVVIKHNDKFDVDAYMKSEMKFDENGKKIEDKSGVNEKKAETPAITPTEPVTPPAKP
ncbi:MAG: lipoprotein LipL31 [Leptospiraceae bacterium]|nr:lipoprotein LipL31 [Leptospiraceae bacterium]MCK6381298.1 lipoprotein LipL31 [Leptospiraceae bacterium]NUM40915.1 lipoprotein LipL31 [Leptospiraceae bacterium]